MTSYKRDNLYWAGRLRKDGHSEILARVEAGEVTMYRATQLAGYRPASPRTPAAKLSHHWKRASADERKRFVAAHPFEIDRALKEFLADRQAAKAQKPSE